jgi:predicted ribosome quality control (RQC) complex YloA/Tae2 family protein
MAQPMDFTTLSAVCHELRQGLPARVEQVVQVDNFTVHFLVKSWTGKATLLVSWHPQTARLHWTSPCPLSANTFVFGQQLAQKLRGLALVSIEFLSAWERVVVLSFGIRPQTTPLWRLHLEVMGKYSNALLVNPDGIVISLAHQVPERQSRLRPIGTGDVYVPPPALTTPAPHMGELYANWQQRLSAGSRPLIDSLVQSYRGVSPQLAKNLLTTAGLTIDRASATLTEVEWRNLFQAWQNWLTSIDTGAWEIYPTQDKGKSGYGIRPKLDIALEKNDPTNPEVTTINQFLDRYYTDLHHSQTFQQLHHKIHQVLHQKLTKLELKTQELEQKLADSHTADFYRQRGDLLSAYANQWRPGMAEITLPEFTTGELVTIPLDPTLNIFQNAQAYYKKHQKYKRSGQAILPFLTEVKNEITYLEAVKNSLADLTCANPENLVILQEIEQELVSAGYLANAHPKPLKLSPKSAHLSINCHRFRSPSNFPILVGRNNWQNDLLALRIAGPYDLWFHAQELPGSHVLLRLNAGDTPTDQDLQTCADLAAYFSKGRYSDRLPVVYTKPEFLHKPKGAKLGMVTYTKERIWWGCPNSIVDKMQSRSKQELDNQIIL